METVKLLRRIFLTGAIVASATMLVSGAFTLFTKHSVKGRELYDQILVNSVEQSNSLNLNQESIFPGESKTYKVTVTSLLVERVKYSFGFSNHEKSEYDKYFYISISSPGDEPYINNTLDQIIDKGYGIYNKVLDSRESKIFYFTFSVSELLSESTEFNFDVVFCAEGKITN
ncbi:MAG: hypothetical protein MJ225_02960 [Bacilli bacterium]|nr:hypothetical protein [Bacilli bacterium]